MKPPKPVTRVLPDGTKVRCRPIRPSDREALAEGFAQLSALSRYQRFHGAPARLTESQLRYLTEIDYVDHMAWAAIDLDAPGKPGIGVSRYVRLPAEPQVAETAITVADDYHGRGVGSLLLELLIEVARSNGITTFRSWVLEGNEPMLALFDNLESERTREDDRVWRIDLPLPPAGEDIGESARARAIWLLARRQAALMRLLWRAQRGTGTADLAGWLQLDEDDLKELEGPPHA